MPLKTKAEVIDFANHLDNYADIVTKQILALIPHEASEPTTVKAICRELMEANMLVSLSNRPFMSRKDKFQIPSSLRSYIVNLSVKVTHGDPGNIEKLLKQLITNQFYL